MAKKDPRQEKPDAAIKKTAKRTAPSQGATRVLTKSGE
jgi:hypothetical protein